MPEKNDSRKTNTLIEKIHRFWLAKILNMDTNGQTGIDLIDEAYAIELKCKLLKKTYQTSIPCADYQYTKFPEDYGTDREMFWAFLYYQLSSPIKEIKDLDNLELFVTDRQVYF